MAGMATAGDDSAAHAAELHERAIALREAGVEVVEVTSVEHAQAVGQFIDAARNDGLRHLGQFSYLDAALTGAVLRPSGDGDLWGRRASKVDITPLVAATIALGGVPAAQSSPWAAYA